MAPKATQQKVAPESKKQEHDWTKVTLLGEISKVSMPSVHAVDPAGSILRWVVS